MDILFVIRVCAAAAAGAGVAGHLAAHMKPGASWSRGGTVSRGTPFTRPQGTSTMRPNAKKARTPVHTRRNT